MPFVTFVGSFIWNAEGICEGRPEGLAPEEIHQFTLTSFSSLNRQTLSNTAGLTTS